MQMQIFALVGYLKKPKETFGWSKKLKMSKKSKSTSQLDGIRELRFMTDLCMQQQSEIEELKSQVHTLKDQYDRANRNIYRANAPKAIKRRRGSMKRAEAVRSIVDNSFSILL